MRLLVNRPQALFLYDEVIEAYISLAIDGGMKRIGGHIQLGAINPVFDDFKIFVGRGRIYITEFESE